MILFSKNGFYMTLTFSLYLLLFTVASAFSYTWGEQFFINMTSYKFYQFQIIPMFLIALAIIDKSITPTVTIRTKNRKHALLFRTGQHYFFAFILLCIYLSIIILVAIFRYKGIENIGISDFIGIFAHYFLGLIIIANLATIISNTSIRRIAGSSYVIVYLIALTELSLVKKLNLYLSGQDMYFVFSWITSNSFLSYAVMIMEALVLTVVLFKISAKADIF